MAYCQNCGMEIPENAKFCAKCGTQVETLSNPPVAETLIPEEEINPKLEEEKTIKRKIGVGKEIEEKYKEESKFIKFRMEHPKWHRFLTGAILFIPGFILGFLYYFTVRFWGKFNFLDFVLSTLVGGGFSCGSLYVLLSCIYEGTDLIRTRSWLKKRSYGENKKCDSDFACSSVLAHREVSLAYVIPTAKRKGKGKEGRKA